MLLYYLLKGMNVLFNIVFIIWLIALSICIAFLYKDYINFKYTKQANEIVRKPGKGFLVPGSGFFAVRDKRKAVVNDDKKAWHNEVNEQS